MSNEISSFYNNSAISSTPINNGLYSKDSSSAPMWIIGGLVVIFLAFNIYIYLAKGTIGVSDFYLYLGEFSTVNPLSEVKYTHNETAADKNTTDETTTDKNTISGAQSSGSTSNAGEVSPNKNLEHPVIQQNKLNDTLNKPDKEQHAGGSKNEYEADDSYSSIQASKSSNKSGWCYIGEDRGFRSCIQVGQDDTCMSGNIFPSQEICVNPNLR